MQEALIDSCAVCPSPTTWELDITEGGVKVAVPTGDCIRCKNCEQVVCGSCVSPADREVCINCRACAACLGDFGSNPVEVEIGTTKPRDPMKAGDTSETLCFLCFNLRAARERDDAKRSEWPIMAAYFRALYNSQVIPASVPFE